MKPLSIHKAAMYFKEADPNTAISETAIRRLVRSGEIRSCKIGKKSIVTLEAIEEYFSGKAAPTVRESLTTGGIRRLPDKN